MVDKLSIRAAKKAGSWYEANKLALSEELSDYLINAQKILSENGGFPKRLRALICPHAGYAYSGPTAGYSYANLTKEEAKIYKNIFFLGPSHYVSFKGCRITQFDYLETPSGNLEVNKDIIDELLTKENFTALPKQNDEEEHSLELQYPFLFESMYKYNLKPKIVPILVGAINCSKAKEIGETLSHYFKDESNLFIVSSDFCHWGKSFGYTEYSGQGEIHAFIERLDKEGINYINNIDLDGFVSYIETTDNTICGQYPIMALLGTIKASKVKAKGELLNYSQSSKVKTKNQSSVSYASIAICLDEKI